MWGRGGQWRKTDGTVGQRMSFLPSALCLGAGPGGGRPEFRILGEAEPPLTSGPVRLPDTPSGDEQLGWSFMSKEPAFGESVCGLVTGKQGDIGES